MESIMEQWELALKGLQTNAIRLWKNKWFLLVLFIIFSVICYAHYVITGYYVSSYTLSFSLSLAFYQTIQKFLEFINALLKCELLFVIVVFLTLFLVGMCRLIIKKRDINVSIAMNENETKNIEDVQIDKDVDEVNNDNSSGGRQHPKLIINDEQLRQLFCDDFRKQGYNSFREFLGGLSGKEVKTTYGKIVLKIYEKENHILRESIRTTSFNDFCINFYESIGLETNGIDRYTLSLHPLKVKIETALNKLLEPTMKE